MGPGRRVVCVELHASAVLTATCWGLCCVTAGSLPGPGIVGSSVFTDASTNPDCHRGPPQGTFNADSCVCDCQNENVNIPGFCKDEQGSCTVSAVTAASCRSAVLRQEQDWLSSPRRLLSPMIAASRGCNTLHPVAPSVQRPPLHPRTSPHAPPYCPTFLCCRSRRLTTTTPGSSSAPPPPPSPPTPPRAAPHPLNLPPPLTPLLALA